jgi:hypothetical protein
MSRTACFATVCIIFMTLFLSQFLYHAFNVNFPRKASRFCHCTRAVCPHDHFLYFAVSPFHSATSLTLLNGGKSVAPGVTRAHRYVDFSSAYKVRSQGCDCVCVCFDWLRSMSIIHHISSFALLCTEAENLVNIPPHTAYVLILEVWCRWSDGIKNFRSAEVHERNDRL